MTTSPPSPTDPDRSADTDAAEDADHDAPAFGPGGYLPDRAARRARKIILRAPMGIQWVIGALVVGVIVVIAGAIALQPDLPVEPFVELPAEAIPTSPDAEPRVVEVAGTDALVLSVLGRTRAFDWSDPRPAVPSYCRESGLLEADDGGAWRATGRGVDGEPSLVELPTVVVEGRVFIDPTSPLPPLDPDDTAAPETACAAAT